MTKHTKSTNAFSIFFHPPSTSITSIASNFILNKNRFQSIHWKHFDCKHFELLPFSHRMSFVTSIKLQCLWELFAFWCFSHYFFCHFISFLQFYSHMFQFRFEFQFSNVQYHKHHFCHLMLHLVFANWIVFSLLFRTKQIKLYFRRSFQFDFVGWNPCVNVWVNS